MTNEPFLYESKNVRAFETKAGSIDAEKRTLWATVSSNMVDRDTDIVLPSAFKSRIGTYRKNPVLLWNHDPFTPPIGKALNVNFSENAIDAEFFFRKDSELAENIFGAFQQGILTSFSVGFRTFKREDGGRTADGKSISKVVDAELFEISAVTVPANTDAVVKHAAMVDALKGALFAGKQERAEIYTCPSDLEITKRQAVIAKRWLEGMRQNKTLRPDERAAAEEAHLALTSLLASSTLDAEAKAAEEELNACLAIMKERR